MSGLIIHKIIMFAHYNTSIMTKHIYSILLLSCTSFFNTNAQVGIGTTTPHASAILDVESSNKGFLPPRLTKAERNSISSPEPGLFIYNTEDNCLQYYTGSFWYDPCCNNAVNSGVDALPILIRIDPTSGSNIIKINTADGTSSGTQAVLNDYVYQISSSVGSYDLTYVAGTSESTGNNHSIFQYTSESSVIPYKDKKFLKRVQGHDGATVSNLSYDFSPDRQDEFEIFIVGKMDSTAGNIADFASFFASGFPSTEAYALQLGVGSGSGTCTKDYYRLTYNNNTTGSTMCGTVDNRVPSDDGELHTFNITSYAHPTTPSKYILSLYIDGNFIEADSNMDGHIKFEELKLFSNRNSDRASAAFIGELIFFDSPLSSGQKETLNEFLVCKYGEE